MSETPPPIKPKRKMDDPAKVAMRRLIKTYHPDTIGSSYEGNDLASAQLLGRLAADAYNSDKSDTWPAGTTAASWVGREITLVENKDGEIKRTTLRVPSSPGLFAQMVSSFQESPDGEVSATLIEEANEARASSQRDGRRGSRHDRRGRPQWERDEDDMSAQIKQRAEEVGTVDEVTSLLQAALLNPRSNMRMLGVLQAIDEAALRIFVHAAEQVTKIQELKEVTNSGLTFGFDEHSFRDRVLEVTDKKAEALFVEVIKGIPGDASREEVRESVLAFPFKDESISERLLALLDESSVSTQEATEEMTGLLEETAVWRPHRLEKKLVRVRSLDASAAVAQEIRKEIEAGNLPESMALVADSRANTLVLYALNKIDTVDEVMGIMKQTAEYPFANPDQGFYALDAAEMRAKYLLCKKVMGANTDEEIEEVRRISETFPFRHEGSKQEILRAIANRRL